MGFFAYLFFIAKWATFSLYRSGVMQVCNEFII